MIDDKRLLGLPLNTERDAVAVLRPKEQRAENQQVQSALQKGDALLLVLSSRHATKSLNLL